MPFLEESISLVEVVAFESSLVKEHHDILEQS